jgi:predicted helicase
MVRSVDALLRSKLGLAAGLADPGVHLLDPAAGTLNFIRAAWRLALASQRACQ